MKYLQEVSSRELAGFLGRLFSLDVQYSMLFSSSEQILHVFCISDVGCNILLMFKELVGWKKGEKIRIL
mgnify:CR=1 FL=1